MLGEIWVNFQVWFVELIFGCSFLGEFIGFFVSFEPAMAFNPLEYGWGHSQT